MRALETLTVELTPEMMRAVGEAVDSGEYASEDEVLRDALRLWRSRRKAERRSDPAPPAERAGD